VGQFFLKMMEEYRFKFLSSVSIATKTIEKSVIYEVYFLELRFFVELIIGIKKKCVFNVFDIFI